MARHVDEIGNEPWPEHDGGGDEGGAVEVDLSGIGTGRANAWRGMVVGGNGCVVIEVVGIAFGD